MNIIINMNKLYKIVLGLFFFAKIALLQPSSCSGDNNNKITSNAN